MASVVRVHAIAPSVSRKELRHTHNFVFPTIDQAEANYQAGLTLIYDRSSKDLGCTLNNHDMSVYHLNDVVCHGEFTFIGLMHLHVGMYRWESGIHRHVKWSVTRHAKIRV